MQSFELDYLFLRFELFEFWRRLFPLFSRGLSFSALCSANCDLFCRSLISFYSRASQEVSGLGEILRRFVTLPGSTFLSCTTDEVGICEEDVL